jgi:hypothetical protein
VILVGFADPNVDVDVDVVVDFDVVGDQGVGAPR